MLGPLPCLLLGIALILFFLLYWRFHPFLALLSSALIVSLTSAQIPLQEAILVVTEGFANLMRSIGILLVLAAIIGKALVESGAADRIIRAFTRAFGIGREQYSFLASGFVLSMPVFFDTVFYLLAPLIRTAYAHRRRDYALMICAAAAGGAITHALVPPTPGPVVVSETLQIPIGITFMVGVLASIVPALVGGVWYANFINRHIEIVPEEVYGVSTDELEKTAMRPDEELPSLFLSLLPIIAPVLLISLSTVVSLAGQDGTSGWLLLGEKNIAFLIGTTLAVWLVVKNRRLSVPQVFRTLEPAVASGTVIAFITCAGGSFGYVLTRSGVGDLIAEAARNWGLSLLTLAFVTAALIRVAQGSATVAMITTAGIIAPAIEMTEMSYHPVYLVSAIGFGATTTSWMNDSGFWIVGQMTGMTEAETLKTWTILLTVVAFSGFFWIWILSTILPLT